MASKFSTPSFSLLRFKVSLSHPYFSSILFNLIPVEKVNDPQFPTMAVDQHMRCYFNPDFLSKLTLDEGVGVMVHEINHLIRDHLGRGKNSGDSYVWNLAGDCEINDDITKDVGCGVKLPSDHLHPSQYKLPEGEIAEWYFEELKKKKETEKGRGGWGDVYMPGAGNCGSAATGQDSPGEEPYEGKDGSGEGDKPNGNGSGASNSPGHSKEMVDLYRKVVAEDVIQRASKSRGTVPSYMERWAKKYLKHKVDWKKEVRSIVKRSVNECIAGLVDHSYRRPNRRQQPGDKFVLPGYIQPLPKIAAITDTSGSMSDKYLSQAHAEIASVLSNSKSEVIFVDCDAAVHYIGNVRNPAQIKFKGGGGTDMTVAYEALAKFKTKPTLVICLTDGFTPWPEEPIKNTKNVIVLLHEGEEPDLKSCPKWAKVLPVHVEPEEEEKKSR